MHNCKWLAEYSPLAEAVVAIEIKAEVIETNTTVFVQREARVEADSLASVDVVQRKTRVEADSLANAEVVRQSNAEVVETEVAIGLVVDVDCLDRLRFIAGCLVPIALVSAVIESFQASKTTKVILGIDLLVSAVSAITV